MLTSMQAESETEFGSVSNPLTMDISLPGLFSSKVLQKNPSAVYLSGELLQPSLLADAIATTVDACFESPG
jgi:hypothetical protein